MKWHDGHRRRWDEVEKILDAVLDMSPAARRQRVAQLCDGDAELEAVLARMLAGCDSDTGLLATPLRERAAQFLAAAPAETSANDPFCGRRLGAWLLLERLGEGGMGVVYRGRREAGDYHCEAAVKLAPGVLLSSELRRRFEIERELLAGLRHPHIATLLDGGATPEGIPYLVTELIEGEPVDRYCERHELDVGARLRLFLQICSAVEYLHHNLIVHRDLKASNILVDASGRVVLLDFGIAKLLADSGPAAATRAGRQPLTPSWAAPEQRRGERITTATDVYALGVLLFRLLAGRPPMAGDDGAPAVGISHFPSELAPADRARGLRGDLDAIAITALAEDPTARYPSAGELRADLVRYLEGRPVTARRPSPGYRAARWVGRHRLASALGAVLAATLVIAGVVVATEARVARSERDAARREALRAQRTAVFLEDLFADADPLGDTGHELSVRELLRRGVEHVPGKGGDPATRADLLSSLGRSLQHLGDSQDAVAAHQRALALRRAAFGVTSREASSSMVDLAESLTTDGRQAAAEGLLRSAIANLRQVAPRSWELANALNALAVGRLDQGDAEGLLAEALTLADAVRDAHPGFRATVLNNLSVYHDHAGHPDRSLALLRAAIAEQRRVYGETHPNLAKMENNLAIRLAARGRRAEAEAEYRSALAILDRTVATDHPALVEPLTSLGHLLLDEGRVSEAAEPIVRAAAIAAAALPDGSFQRLAAESNLAALELARGHVVAAERAYRRLLARMTAAVGENHPGTARIRSLLGDVLRREGHLDEAERLLRAALDAERRSRARPAARADTLESLGALLCASGRCDEGARLRREAAALRPSDAAAG